MNLRFILSVAFLGCCCLIGCEKGAVTDNTIKNALIIQPASDTKADGDLLTKDGNIIYPIGSVFYGGGVSNPAKGVALSTHFFRDSFQKCPDLAKETAFVTVYGFRHADDEYYSGVEYKEPGLFVEEILIRGLDESLGLGPLLEIPMNQGEYKGGNDLIKDVRIKSFKYASYTDDKWTTQNKDADINIVITSTAGDIITICFTNEITPFNGYY